jgi:uncharacterized protein YjbI with pentapeptide repeats
MPVRPTGIPTGQEPRDLYGPNIEAALEAWWAAWWSADYSWEGLKRHFVNGWIINGAGVMVPGSDVPEDGRRATLQDYWREEETEGRLIEELGEEGEIVRQWTRMHLPLVWRSGKTTGKSDWSRSQWHDVQQCIARKLGAAQTTEHAFRSGAQWLFSERQVADRRAKLNGCVIERLSVGGDSLHLDAEQSCLEIVELGGHKLGPNAWFRNVLFLRDADFSGIDHIDRAEFFGCLFQGDANFAGSKFGSRVSFESSFIVGDAYFQGVEFAGDLNFSKAHFYNDALFDHAAILGLSNFEGSAFWRAVSFGGMRFANDANFNGANLAHVETGSFRRARFEGALEFHGTRWPAKPEPIVNMFSEAQLPVIAEFSGASLLSVAAFNGAMIGGEIRFGSVRRDDLTLALASKGQQGSRSDALLHQLEGGFRFLKRSAENNRDKLAEQKFYKGELTCRRLQRATPRAERVFSLLYGLVSDYGLSMGRPLLTLALLWLVFSVFFAVDGLIVQPRQGMPHLWGAALEMSARLVFQPFSIWGNEFRDVFKEIICKKQPWLLFVSLVGTLESVVSTALLFLTGLALKRRFQIN